MASKRQRGSSEPVPNAAGAPTTPSRPRVAKRAATSIAVQANLEAAASRPVFASDEQVGLAGVAEVELELADDEAILIGRAVDGDAGDQSKIRLFTGVASARHCSVVGRGGRFFVRDERSTHGTFVDGVELERGGEVAIADGARVRIGRTGGAVDCDPVELCIRLHAIAAPMPPSFGRSAAAASPFAHPPATDASVEDVGPLESSLERMSVSPVRRPSPQRRRSSSPVRPSRLDKGKGRRAPSPFEDGASVERDRR